MKKFLIVILTTSLYVAGAEQAGPAPVEGLKFEFDIFRELPLDMQQEIALGVVRSDPLISSVLGKMLSGSRRWGNVYSIAYSPNGTQLASGSDDGSIIIWDPTTGNILRILEQGTLGEDSSRSSLVAYSPDGTRLAAVSSNNDEMVKIWNIGTGNVVKTLCHNSSITSIAYSPDGNQIAFGSRGGRFDNNKIRIWDIDGGGVIQTLYGHLEKITSMAYSPNGKQLASGSHDGTVKIWDLSTGDLLGGKISLDDTGRRRITVLSVAYSPDGKYVAYGPRDGTIRIWNLDTDIVQKIDARNIEHEYDYVYSVAYSPDGKQLASGSFFGIIKIWDPGTGNLLQTFRDQIGRVHLVAYSPDGKQLASAGVGGIKIWPLELTPEQAWLLLLLYMAYDVRKPTETAKKVAEFAVGLSRTHEKEPQKKESQLYDIFKTFDPETRKEIREHYQLKGWRVID